MTNLIGKFKPRGVFWRHFLAWAIHNIPPMLEPATMWLWSFFFWAFWGHGRRSVVKNLELILPGSSWLANQYRSYLVFLNFAWTFTDAGRFHEENRDFDWELVGMEHLDALSSPDTKAIILTAHMGNYDLGSFAFASRVKRTIATVRVPEMDPESQEYSAARRERFGGNFRVLYNTGPSTLVFDLLHAIQDGQVVAIQGDRVLPGVNPVNTTLFGRTLPLPQGPFALALATRAMLYPLFVVRLGHRRYRVIAMPPFVCAREGTPRETKEHAIGRAVTHWSGVLEAVLREHWSQWFYFDPLVGGGETPDA